MSWSEASPGIYQRPLGDNERFIKLIGDRAHPAGREQWSVTATAAFKASDGRTATQWSDTLRKAWKLLRFEHPSIASTATDDTLEYLIPNPSVLPKWVNETFFVVEDPAIGADDLIPTLKPSPFVTLHYLPARWEVVLHTAHWRTDAYGAFQLLNAFFVQVASAVDSPPSHLPWGQEVPRLVPSVETALDLPAVATPDVEAAARRYLSTAMHIPGTVGVVSKGEPTTRPGGTRRVCLQLSKSTTEALVTACQTHAVSLFATVHAALAAVNYTHAPADAREKHYTSTIRLSLRPHLPEVYSKPALAAGLYTGGYMCKVPATNSWAENATQYQAEYDHGVSEEFLASRRQYAILALEGLRKGIPPPPVSNIDVSTVEGAEQLVTEGLDTKDGRLEILRLGLGVETLNRQTYCMVWVFRGQLEFNLWFNEAFYDATMAGGMLETLRKTLLGELRVDG